mmetsp:Transcript_10348/g.17998  ORF Transcript_10348/g.17998 Transcript_10348/m.17998 type:complete len:422 (-) Transcript_10348:66-1331(-)
MSGHLLTHKDKLNDGVESNDGVDQQGRRGENPVPNVAEDADVLRDGHHLDCATINVEGHCKHSVLHHQGEDTNTLQREVETIGDLQGGVVHPGERQTSEEREKTRRAQQHGVVHEEHEKPLGAREERLALEVRHKVMEGLGTADDPAADLTGPLLNLVHEAGANGGTGDDRHGQQQHGHLFVGAAHPAHLGDDVIDSIAGVDETCLEAELQGVGKDRHGVEVVGDQTAKHHHRTHQTSDTVEERALIQVPVVKQRWLPHNHLWRQGQTRIRSAVDLLEDHKVVRVKETVRVAGGERDRVRGQQVMVLEVLVGFSQGVVLVRATTRNLLVAIHRVNRDDKVAETISESSLHGVHLPLQIGCLYFKCNYNQQVAQVILHQQRSQSVKQNFNRINIARDNNDVHEFSLSCSLQCRQARSRHFQQ